MNRRSRKYRLIERTVWLALIPVITLLLIGGSVFGATVKDCRTASTKNHTGSAGATPGSCCCCTGADDQCSAGLNTGCSGEQQERTSSNNPLPTSHNLTINLTPLPVHVLDSSSCHENGGPTVFLRETVYLINARLIR